MGFRAEEFVVLTADQVEISGSLRLPARIRGVALLMHGITVDRHEYLGFYDALAESLNEAGIASVQFDFRGHGASVGPGGSISIAGQCLDTRAVIRYVRSIQELTDVPLSLIGTSFGGPPALYSADTDKNIAKLVLFAPVLDYSNVFLNPVTEWGRRSFSRTSIAAAYISGELLIDGAFPLPTICLEEMRLLSPLAALTKCDHPILIVHGEDDSIVPFETSALAASSNPRVRLLAIPKMDHGYIVRGDDAGSSPDSIRNKKIILQAITDFITH
jgi:pimeloyl-ACP methyl ester carboxylesterase